MSRERSLVLLASAGTGKTYRLTLRLLELFFAGVAPERVLASTFTRKAAGEILGRLFGRLVEAAESEAAAARLGTELARPIDRGRAAELCVELLRGIDRLRVATLDAYFKERVEQASFELGLPADWDVADPLLFSRLCARALSRALERPRTPAEWSTLIADLRRGGAESRVHAGLTSTLAHAGRIARECTAEAWEFPPLPSDASAADFERALGVLQAAEPARGKNGAPRKNWEKALARIRAALADEEWQAFATETLLQKVIDGSLRYDSVEIPAELAAALRVLLARAAHKLAKQVRAQNRALCVLTRDFLAELDLATRAERLLAFDELPRLFAEHEKSSTRRGGIDHLLLDEFQDTSSLQWRALERGVADAVHGDATSFFCVGDVKQSIYAWRAGNPRLLAELGGRLGVSEQTMAENRRSGRAILEFVNLVFESLSENQALATQEAREAARRFSKQFTAHTPAHEIAATVRVFACGEVEDKRRVRPKEELRLARGVQAAAQIARAHPDWTIAFLVRKKKLVPELIERLGRVGLAASAEGGNPLTDSGAVNAALSLLEFADHPADELAAFHVATSPFGPFAGLAFPFEPGALERSSRSLRERWLELGPRGFLAGLRGLVAANFGAFDRRRFEQLVALAERLEPPERLRPAAFAERLALERVADAASSRVRVLTVHGAKGLEFDAVILLDLDGPLTQAERKVVAHRRDGDPRQPYDVVTHPLEEAAAALVPELAGVLSAAKTARLQEELCVLYVALTRAKRHLELVIDHPGDNLARSSLAGIVLAALGVESVQPASFVGEEGLAQSSGEAPTLEPAPLPTGRVVRVDESAPAAPRPLAPIRLLPAAGALSSLSPSRAAGGASAQGRPTAEWFRYAEVARRRGTLWHAWMEAIDWSDAPPPAVEELQRRAEEAGLGAIDVAEARAFLTALGADSIQSALSRAETARRLGVPPETLRLQRERRFACRIALPGSPASTSVLLEGAFDRAVIAPGTRRAELVDFKTDALTAQDLANLAARAEVYRPQLELYRTALARLEGLEEPSIALAIVFLAAGRVVTLETRSSSG